MGPGGQSMMRGMSGRGIAAVVIAAVVIAAIVVAVLLLLGTAILITIRASAHKPQLARATDHLLASDRARERTVDLLASAFASAHLTREELEDRTRLALAARTRADLSLLTHDVPRDPERE